MKGDSIALEKLLLKKCTVVIVFLLNTICDSIALERSRLLDYYVIMQRTERGDFVLARHDM